MPAINAVPGDLIIKVDDADPIGNQIQIQAGDGVTLGDGGNINLLAGNGAGNGSGDAGSGGSILISGGACDGENTFAGTAQIQGGSGSGAGGTGGDLDAHGGPGDVQGGNVTITGGLSGTVGAAGNVTISASNGGVVRFGALPVAAPANGKVNNSQFTFWVDEATHKLMVKLKYSDGTVKSGEVALT
jgi:hypothetical protein